MAKIKDISHTSPSQQIIEEENKEIEVFDEKGRKFTLKRPSLLKEMQFELALGNDNGKVIVYRTNAFFLQHIYKIDGVPIPKVDTQQLLDALMERVGHSGMFAIIKGVKDHLYPEAFLEEKGQKEHLKK